LHHSQNTFEESLIRVLVIQLPDGVKVIVWTDREFGREENTETCHELNFRYLIRIRPEVWVTHPSYTERLDGYALRKGCWRVLSGAEYRSDKAVTLNVVIRWRTVLPAHRYEPWF
jgi:hypothetical protein